MTKDITRNDGWDGSCGEGSFTLADTPTAQKSALTPGAWMQTDEKATKGVICFVFKDDTVHTGISNGEGSAKILMSVTSAVVRFKASHARAQLWAARAQLRRDNQLRRRKHKR